MILSAAVKQKLFRIAEVVHLRIFGHEMGGEMRRFLGNLSWSFFGGGIASVIMLFINIFAGRLIGPEGYGKYALIASVSQIVMLFTVFGLDVASVRIISKEASVENKSKYISSAFYFVLITIVSLILTYLFFDKFVFHYFSLESDLILFTVIFTCFFSLRSILDVSIRGLGLFKEQFIARTMESLTIFILFIIFFIYFKKINYQNYILILSGGAFVISFFYFRKLRIFFTKFDHPSLNRQLSYGKLIFIGSIFGSIFNSADKVVIAKYLSITQLGIYGAYFTVSTNLILQLVQVFANPFLPAAAKSASYAFIEKLNKVFYWGFVPCLFIISSMIFLLMKFFGSAYNHNIGYVFVFGLLATLQIVSSVNYIVISAISENLYKKYIIKITIINLFNFLIYFILIYLQLVTILTIVGTLILNSIVTIMLQKRMILNFLEKR